MPQLMQGRLATARRRASLRTGAALGMGAAAVVAEAKKRKLEEQNLTAEEYEQAVILLARRLWL